MPADSARLKTKEGKVFFRVYNYYMNSDRSIFAMAAMVSRHTASLGIVDWSMPFISLQTKANVAYRLLAVSGSYLIAKLKRRLALDVDARNLPDLGEIAVRCFPNYLRLFDLKRARIVNLDDDPQGGSSHRFDVVVKHQTLLGEIGVAPRILDVCNEGAGYVEALTDGISLNRTNKWADEEMLEKVCTGAGRIQECGDTRRAKISELLEELATESARLRAPENGCVDDGFANWLVDEYERIRSRINPESTLPLYLSHGDLARRNILVGRDGNVVFIDWQTVGYRTRDFDVINYHFSLIKDDLGSMFTREDIFQKLRSKLTRQNEPKTLAEFELLFLLTRLKYFVLPAFPDPARRTAACRQLKSYMEIAREYGEFAT